MNRRMFANPFLIIATIFAATTHGVVVKRQDQCRYKRDKKREGPSSKGNQSTLRLLRFFRWLALVSIVSKCKTCKYILGRRHSPSLKEAARQVFPRIVTSLGEASLTTRSVFVLSKINENYVSCFNVRDGCDL